jgi:hypothetical protein
VRRREQVASMHDAHQPVERAAAERVARMRHLDDAIERRLGRQVRLEPADVGPGHHDVARLPAGELEDVVQDLLLRARDHA